MNLKSKKMAVTIMAAILLVILYVVIFNFSAQDGETSSSISHEISETCVETINVVAGRGWPQEIKSSLSEYFEHPIRKIAHFSEYALMGTLLFVIFSQWMERSKKFYLIIVGWVFISASFDEIHQLFSNGRNCSIIDVFIDTAGAVTALCIVTLLIRIFSKKGGTTNVDFHTLK